MNCTLQKYLKNHAGATLVEFSLILPLLMIMTLGTIEAGYILYQHNAAQKATQIGARFTSTRSSLVTGLSDCGVATNADAGTDCVNVAGASSWSTTCQGASPGGNCDAVIMADVLVKMQGVFPNIQAANLKIVFSGTGLGYVGRGRPVPAITVSLENLTYNYIAIGGLVNLGDTLNLSTASSTIIAEDIRDGNG